MTIPAPKPDQCNDEHDRGPGARPRRIYCIKAPAHPGEHFATWGGAQAWRQMNWPNLDSPAPEPSPHPMRSQAEVEALLAKLVVAQVDPGTAAVLSRAGAIALYARVRQLRWVLGYPEGTGGTPTDNDMTDD